MINHPMLMPRDPPPEIDVTRPALTKHSHVDSFVFVVSTPTTIEFTTVMAPVAADQFKEGDPVMVLDCQTLRREPHTFHKENEYLFVACPLGGNPILDLYCYLRDRYLPRHPTDAELAEHWPEVLP